METEATNLTPERADQNSNSSPSPKPKRSKKQHIRDRDVAHVKYFEQIAPLLECLRDVGCQRDIAHNRELHYDQYCLLILLFLFNPMVDSLRAIQRASELKKVQQRLGCPRTSLGSLSEATQVFDPELLKPIIAQLGEQLLPISADKRLKDILQTITLVDGTLLSALPSMMEASVLKAEKGSGKIKWRLHTHFEVAKNWPVRMDLSPNGGGEHDERAMLAKVLQVDRLYVMDRGYAKFALLLLHGLGERRRIDAAY